jgi:hypothetical protein
MVSLMYFAKLHDKIINSSKNWIFCIVNHLVASGLFPWSHLPWTTSWIVHNLFYCSFPNPDHNLIKPRLVPDPAAVSACWPALQFVVRLPYLHHQPARDLRAALPAADMLTS